jgi:hypothetical protein
MPIPYSKTSQNAARSIYNPQTITKEPIRHHTIKWIKTSFDHGRGNNLAMILMYKPCALSQIIEYEADLYKYP